MQNQMFDVYRAGLKSAAEMMSVSLSNAQRLQQQQLEVFNHALHDQLQSMQQLADVRSFEELVTVQSRLTGAQMERMMDYWNRMWRLAGENQMALIGHAQSQAGQVRDATVATSTSLTSAMREAAQNQERRAEDRKSA